MCRSNVSKHFSYSVYYTAETRELVRQKFEEDIQYFGYAFESLPMGQHLRYSLRKNFYFAKSAMRDTFTNKCPKTASFRVKLKHAVFQK